MATKKKDDQKKSRPYKCDSCKQMPPGVERGGKWLCTDCDTRESGTRDMND